MTYVLDSSVGVKWVVPEVHTVKAIRLRDDFRNAVHELIAPDVFPIEVGHSLTRAERQGRITPPESGIFWQDLMTTAPLFRPSLPLMPRAIDISSRTRQGVYDCLYIALAEHEGCELVTADDKLIKNLQSQFPFIIPLASMP